MKGVIQQVKRKIRAALQLEAGVSLTTHETETLNKYLGEVAVLEDACRRGLVTSNVLERLEERF
jgi:hypothetical protein